MSAESWHSGAFRSPSTGKKLTLVCWKTQARCTAGWPTVGLYTLQKVCNRKYEIEIENQEKLCDRLNHSMRIKQMNHL